MAYKARTRPPTFDIKLLQLTSPLFYRLLFLPLAVESRYLSLAIPLTAGYNLALLYNDKTGIKSDIMPKLADTLIALFCDSGVNSVALCWSSACRYTSYMQSALAFVDSLTARL